MNLHRSSLAGCLLLCLGALSGGALAAPLAEVNPSAAGEPRASGRLSRFMSAHGWRLLSSLGIDAGAAIYGKHFGPSNEPLLFEDVPGFDAAVHATLSKGTPSPTYLGLYGLETIKYASWLAIIGIDLGNRHEMAGDIFGAAESFFMNRGLTSLGKDVVGRVRPDLQYADPKALGRAEFLALRAEPDEYRSFPSGHASGSFTWAAYLDRVIARKVGMRSAARKLAFAALYGAAGYIGYTRIREGEHYFSDIVAGAGLGIWVSRSNYRAEHPEEFGQRENRRPARLRFYPPRIFHGGAAWTLGIRLGVDRS